MRVGLVWMALAGGACDPGTEVHYIEFRAASDPGIGRAFLLPEMQNTGGSSLALGPIAGNMGEVQYDLDEQMRAFLLPVNLTDFVFSGEYLHLPRMEASTPTPRVVTIVPDDTPKWQSFRVYDAGACSQMQPWSVLAPVLVQGLTDGFVNSPRVTNGSRVGEASVLPMLHATGADGRILNVDDDRIAIHAEFHADRIGEPIGTLGCDDSTVTINIEVGFRRSAGVLEFPPCSTSGGALLLDDGFSFDFDGVVHSVRVNHDSEGCRPHPGAERRRERGFRSGLGVMSMMLARTWTSV